MTDETDEQIDDVTRLIVLLRDRADADEEVAAELDPLHYTPDDPADIIAGLQLMTSERRACADMIERQAAVIADLGHKLAAYMVELEERAVVWTATDDGIACRRAFEDGRSFLFAVAFNPTTEHYHRDNGIGHFDAYHDGEWQMWRKAWQAARAHTASEPKALTDEQKAAITQAADVMGANGFHWVEETLRLVLDEAHLNRGPK
jgi:hypothetical protein